MRAEPWLQAGRYIGAVTGGLAKRNGWTIAEYAGDRSPQRTQRLLNRAVGDAFTAMGVVRRFAVAGLDEAARRHGRQHGLRIGAIDETSQVKQGSATAGVKRQYLGCVGKVANGITMVHLSYVRERTGHALIGARQWIPQEHISDPVKQRAMGLPDDLVFRTKGELATGMCTEAFADGAAFDFVCGTRSTAAAPGCGSSSKAASRPTCCGFGAAFTSRWPAGHPYLRRCGHRAAERHPPLGGPLRGQGLQGRALVCLGAGGHCQPSPSSADPQASQDRRAGLSLLLCPPRPAGEHDPAGPRRWAQIAGGRRFRFGKGCFGLDQSQVRLYHAIARHTVLVMAALAVCAVTAALLRDRTDTQAPPPARPSQPPPADPGMIPLTVPELTRLLTTRAAGPGHAEHWSNWRRRHQARSRWYHQRTRLARDTGIALVT